MPPARWKDEQLEPSLESRGYTGITFEYQFRAPASRLPETARWLQAWRPGVGGIRSDRR